ncbi:MAG TPA: (2Fe-2S)-binding protein [Saprospiraceae bacterium]|nr:(2Fe-2S)-binding protein [Saprospiraceae bacterium]HNT20445.1 (2Fe-2S)-binding protein [Saprospiraceae bacterium]
MAIFNLTINDQRYKIEAEEDMPLLWAIRDLVGLKGTKYGCGIAQCGACTVHLDGQPVRSCSLPLGVIKKKQKITTIEGIGSPQLLHAVQEAWVEEQVPQCGYCQSGQIMSAVALLAQHPEPSDDQIDTYMNGNLCRCGTYDRIRKAIHRASGSAKPKTMGTH